MEVLYFYCAKNAEEGHWVKLGASFFLESGPEYDNFVPAKYNWPPSNVVQSTNVLLGENGRGKTTTLLRIFSSLSYGNELGAGCAILIKSGKNITLIKDREFKRDVRIQGAEPITVQLNSKDLRQEELENVLRELRVVIVDPVLRHGVPLHVDSLTSSEFHGSIDMRSQSLLVRANRAPFGELSYSEFYYRELERDLSFLASSEASVLNRFLDNQGKKEFPIPEKLYLNLNTNLFTELKRKFTYDSGGKPVSFDSPDYISFRNHESFVNHLELMGQTAKDFNVENLIEALYGAALASHLYSRLTNGLTHDEYFSLIEDIIKIQNRGPKFILEHIQKKWEGLLAVNVRSSLAQMERFAKVVRSEIRSDENGWYFSIRNNRALVAEMQSTYLNAFGIRSLVNFSWHEISGGETVLLKVFSRVYHAALEIRTEKKLVSTVILLLDEPDSNLHPEWERKLLKQLIKFCEEVFPGLKIQMLIATNKPFILSDLTIYNINILTPFPKADASSAFAPFCNRISAILANGFFLESDIGALSEEFLDRLQERDYHPTILDRKVIDEIGDNFLKQAVVEYLGDDQ
ncbi:MAG: hypothetical protein OM95_02105 [Bdellovibrio sp. ArHS]|uniref:AAA family ATPase n=1 Tax=Bdellovibrio sp. ArHS TaxID=1569284 RepID=UPI000582570C|nr:AAA family ATPase [Bdellovibrio sp. ArHS]KHD89871.1 MAG: hypothetical protein OM95_02105 [Bdellovibrio sp. ArHS]